jgi:hypothetical protein
MENDLVVKRHQIYGRIIINKWPLGWWWFRAAVFDTPYPAAN